MDNVRKCTKDTINIFIEYILCNAASEGIAAATLVGLGAALAFMAAAIICVVFLTLCVWKR